MEKKFKVPGRYHNFEISDEQKDTLIAAGTGVLSNFLNPTGLQADIRAACGMRPIFAGDKRTKWEDCSAKVLASKTPAPGAGSPGAPGPTESGLSTGAIIGFSVGGLAVIGLLLFIATRKASPTAVA